MKIYVLVKRSICDAETPIDVTVFDKKGTAKAQMECEFLAEEEDAYSRENIEEDGWDFHDLSDTKAIIRPCGSDFRYKWEIFEREV